MPENKELLNSEPKEYKSGLDIIDLKPNAEPLPREVKSWMEKVEEAGGGNLPTVTDDKSGQALLSPAAPVNPKIVLPVSKKTFSTGFKKAVTEAGRWLSEYIFRLIKIKKGNVKFKEE